MGKEVNVPDCIVFCCLGDKCKKNGGKEIAKHFKKEIKRLELKDQVSIIKTLCTGNCELGPIVSVQPDNMWYKKVKQKDVEPIIAHHKR